jgi:hypothetical protein
MNSGKAICPEYKINSADSIYTASPSLIFSIQEMEKMLRAKSYYCETLDQALDFISATSHKIVTVVNTTVYYREKDSFQERCIHVQKTLNQFNNMMEALRNPSKTKYGYLRIDYKEQKLLEEKLEIEGHFRDERTKYWLSLIIQSSFQGKMKLMRHQVEKYGDLINSIFIIKEENDQYIVRLMIHRTKGVQFEINKNQGNKGSVEGILGYPTNQVFTNESRLRKAFANYSELNHLASQGNLDAWKLVNELYLAFMKLDIKNIDTFRLYSRLIKNRSCSMVLHTEIGKETVASQLYYELYYEKISPREFEVRRLTEEIKKKEKWIVDNLWGNNYFNNQLKEKLSAEIKGMQKIVKKLEQELKELRAEARRLELGVEGSVNYLLKQIIAKNTKTSLILGCCSNVVKQ